MKLAIKLASLLIIFTALTSNIAGANIAQPASRYSVTLKTVTSSCTGKDYADAFTVQFGERDKTGRCLDNTGLNCTKRFTLSLGTAFEPELLSGGPSICSSAGKNCVEVQLSFVRAPKTDEEYVSLATFGHRGGQSVKGESSAVKASLALEAPRRFVISLDACHYTTVDFKVTPR